MTESSTHRDLVVSADGHVPVPADLCEAILDGTTVGVRGLSRVPA